MADCSRSPSRRSPESALDVGCSSSIPDGEGGGEDRLSDDYVEVRHHSLWQVGLQLRQKIHPLLGFFGDGAGAQLPVEVWFDDVPRKQDSTVSTGESHSVKVGGWAYALPPEPSPLSLEC